MLGLDSRNLQAYLSCHARLIPSLTESCHFPNFKWQICFYLHALTIFFYLVIKQTTTTAHFIIWHFHTSTKSFWSGIQQQKKKSTSLKSSRKTDQTQLSWGGYIVLKIDEFQSVHKLQVLKNDKSQSIKQGSRGTFRTL